MPSSPETGSSEGGKGFDQPSTTDSTATAQLLGQSSLAAAAADATAAALGSAALSGEVTVDDK